MFDTHRADLFARPIEQRATLLVPVIALFEVHKVLSRKVPSAAVTQCLDVMRLGRVLEITDRRAVAAAEVSAKYSLALELGATFWTQDVGYQGLPSVTYFAKA